MLKLPIVTVAGTPTAMGSAYGEALRGMIAAFVEERLRAARVYLRERGVSDERTFLRLGGACLERLAIWDGEGHAELIATARAAEVDPVALYTAGNMTDIRDILALPIIATEREGCTTALVPGSHSAGGRVIAGQTWDLNPGDLDFVVAVQRNPVSGPRTFSVTVAGCPSLVGMNEHGVAVGTTNIKTRGSRVGIPYLSLLHRAIRCASRAEASELIRTCPLAAAHSYWIADASGVEDWERTPDSAVRRDGGPLTRTNHCLSSLNQPREGEPASASSRARLARAQGVLSAGGLTVEALRALFSDRSDGVDSINRFAEDGQGTSTNACVVAVPAKREIHACRGSADRGEWIRFAF